MIKTITPTNTHAHTHACKQRQRESQTQTHTHACVSPDEVVVPAPSAGDSAVSMTNAITVARFVSGVMEIECEFSTVSGSCNNGVQWSMWDSMTRSSSFSDHEIII